MSFEFDVINCEKYQNFLNNLEDVDYLTVTPRNLPKEFPLDINVSSCVLSSRFLFPIIKNSSINFIKISRYKNYAEKIKKFEVREDDIWLISYPKSGTTWTQEMIWLLKNNIDFEAAQKEILLYRFPFLE
jgi:hypothetical protein